MSERDEVFAGAWDIHVHAAPSLFPRWGDGWDLVDACRRAGMGGVVLKAHEGSTVETAGLLDRRSDDLRVLGGLVLNHFVGGLNPLAVEQAVALGARIVWLPTIHAAHHGAVTGRLGAFPFQGSPLSRTPQTGLTVMGEDGSPSAELRDILALLDSTDVVLGTGHLSPVEIHAVRRALDADARRVRLLVNHVMFTVPALSVADLEALAGTDVYFEVCDLSTCALTAATTPANVARALAKLPSARWIMASDSGQRDNVPSPDALHRYQRALAAEGVDPGLLARMIGAHPRALFE